MARLCYRSLAETTLVIIGAQALVDSKSLDVTCCAADNSQPHFVRAPPLVFTHSALSRRSPDDQLIASEGWLLAAGLLRISHFGFDPRDLKFQLTRAS